MYDPWGCTDNKPKKYRADGGIGIKDILARVQLNVLLDNRLTVILENKKARMSKVYAKPNWIKCCHKYRGYLLEG